MKTEHLAAENCAMLAVTTRLPGTQHPDHNPVLLVHGAANSAGVWTFWQEKLAAAGLASHAIDLRGHGASGPCDLSSVGMSDYADDVIAFARGLAAPPVLIGWSMGGLVAMLAASRGGPVRAVVGLAPSTPSARLDDSLPLRAGEFDAAEYGITSTDPEDQPAMPDLDRDERAIALVSLCFESRYARDERARGVVIDALPCPLLIVTGTADTQWPRRRYDPLHLPADHISVEGASHWGLVLNRRVLDALVPRVLHWVERVVR